MSDLPSWIKAIVDLKPKFLFGVWFLGVLILFLPKDISDELGFTSAIDPYKGLIGLITLAAFIFWLVQLEPWTRITQWRSAYKKRIQINRVDQDITALSPDEKLRLAYCLDRNRTYIVLDINDPIAISLRRKGILIPNPSSESPYRAHRVSELAWEQLQKNKSKLFQESFWHDPQVRHSFDQLDHLQRNPFANLDF